MQQIDGNIIGPTILGDSTGLSPFWVIVSILVGGGLFGFLGMLLGVPTFAVIYFLIKTLSEYHLKKKQLPTDSMLYCKIEKIDPETGEVCLLPKQSVNRKTQSDPGLTEALDVIFLRKSKRHNPRLHQIRNKTFPPMRSLRMQTCQKNYNLYP